MVSARVRQMMLRLGEDVDVCNINEEGDAECYKIATKVMDNKLKEMRGLIERQKQYHAFRKYSYDKLDESLKEIGY